MLYFLLIIHVTFRLVAFGLIKHRPVPEGRFLNIALPTEHCSAHTVIVEIGRNKS